LDDCWIGEALRGLGNGWGNWEWVWGTGNGDEGEALFDRKELVGSVGVGGDRLAAEYLPLGDPILVLPGTLPTDIVGDLGVLLTGGVVVSNKEADGGDAQETPLRDSAVGVFTVLLVDLDRVAHHQFLPTVFVGLSGKGGVDLGTSVVGRGGGFHGGDRDRDRKRVGSGGRGRGDTGGGVKET